MPAPLISDRQPLILIERGRICVGGQFVLVERDGKKINIPVRNTHLLILGNGTSITSEAMHICAKERCHIAQSKGGFNIHSIFHSGLWANPKRLCNQVMLADNKESRLRAAKYIAIGKMESLSVQTKAEIEQISNAVDIPTILGIEGAITKKEYKHTYGSSFLRNGPGFDQINKNISVLNSVLYSFVTSLVCALGYSPSVGFLHGHTRRGGLVFDIADMFKHRIYLHKVDLLLSDKNMARELSLLLSSNRNAIVKEIISEIETICGGAI